MMGFKKGLTIFVEKLDLFVTDIRPYILIGLAVIVGCLVIFRIVDTVSDMLERKKKGR